METVGDLIKNLQQFNKDLPLVYAIDEEGNSYNYVVFEPTKGKFDGNDFIAEDEDDKEYYAAIGGKEVICVN